MTTTENGKSRMDQLLDMIARHHEEASRHSLSAYVHLKQAEDPCDGDCDEENGCDCPDAEASRKHAEIYAQLAHTEALAANAIAIVLSKTA